MTDLSSQILSRIMENQGKLLPHDAGLVLPYYDRLSLTNLPATISHLLGTPSFGEPPLDEAILAEIGGPYEKIIFLLVDALGYPLLEELIQQDDHLIWGSLRQQAVYTPITSICPSTTASALTTLWTGVAPATHGIIGYEMWAREFGLIMNNILHSPASARNDVGGLLRSGFDPHAFLDRPLLGTHLKNNGISTTAFMHSGITRSGLSTMQLEDVAIHAYVDEADLFVSLAEHVNSRPGVREYIYVYYSDVDSLMHRFSTDDSRIALQFSAFSNLCERAFLNQLDRQAIKDTLLILTADHGSVVTPINPRYDLINHPELTANLVMQPTCEHRLAFLYIKPGCVDAIKAYFARTWPEEFILIESEKALEEGLFGLKPHKLETRDRIGDLIAVPRGTAYLWWALTPNPMAGRHGGLSTDEMLVPFLALPMDRLRVISPAR